MDRRRLTPEEIRAMLAKRPDWSDVGGKLHRRFVFEDFVEAFGFMTRVALIAERMNHHPDWSNAWRTVDVDLSTHDSGGITTLDFELAGAIDACAEGARSKGRAP